jgi:probable rRNA maturation factor
MNVTVSNRQRLLKVDSHLLKEIARRALELVDAPAYHLNIVLVNEKMIAKLNKQYHHADGPTDVLSFDYGDGQGELIVSAERASAQARRFHTTPARELALYVIHGILHLHGYDDTTTRKRACMRAAERRLLARLQRSLDVGKLL